MPKPVRAAGAYLNERAKKVQPVSEPDPEVAERATRRRFTAQYKAGVVAQAARCHAPGEVAALLRREGLYSSHLAAWRRTIEEHGVESMAAKKRGPSKRPARSAREATLDRQVRHLEKRLAKAMAIIDFQKKVHEILGIPLRTHETDGDE